MNKTILALGAILAGCGGSAEREVQPCAPESSPTEIMRVADVRPGMKGYGLSVFEKTKIERFDVEVVSVLKKYMGDKDIILVRCKHAVTDHANVIHGMSGSPIYLEGKLAGALALGFSEFPKDPLAGITPIEYMLAEKEHPWEDEEASLPQESPFRWCRAPLFVSGLPPAAFGGLKRDLAPLGFDLFAGSAGPAEAPQDLKLEPGAAVGITFLRGDINMDGVGTVTHVAGNDVWVFGHPMFMGGQMELPMATAFVHTVIADQTYSYKLSSVVQPVGTILQDRLTACYGVLGKPAPMIPLSVDIENAQTRQKSSYRFEVARHPIYTPYLVAQVPGYCLQLAQAGEGKDSTVEYQLKLKFQGYPEIELRDRYVSAVLGIPARGFEPILFQLVGNAFRKVRLEKASVKLNVVHRRASATVDGIWPDTRQVKPGDTLGLTVRLRPYNREPVKLRMDVPLPSNLPSGEYRLALMGGAEASGGADMQSMLQALLSGKMGGLRQSEAQSFEELLDQIRRRQPANRLVARLVLPSLGMRYKDRTLENLPGSVFVNLASNASAGLRIEEDKLEVAVPTEWVIEGQKSVKFEVRTPGQVEPESK